MVHEAGYKNGLYGARIAGGGSGGTVAVLANTSARGLVEEIAARYEEETGLYAQIF
jgi:L-arabinokinase